MKAHEMDVTSLVFGLVFTATALVWALVQVEVITVSMLPVAVPVVLVVVGVIGVVASVYRGRAREDRSEL